jgi:polar amino acid transport system substrate-binding protein
MWQKKVITLMILLVLALPACNMPTPAPTATPAPTQTQPPPDDSWDKIQQAGVLKVGTSADYPPFEYYDEDKLFTGFDIALIQAIGQRLGVNVEITDFAFDGLAMSVASGQVDVVISALSVTPERQTIAAFSNVYYAGTDAVLARPDADPLDIQDPEALARARLGVQLNSIYETYAQEKLINAGLMPKQNLFVYVDISQAVDALKAKSIDAVWLDLAPAQQFVDDSSVEILVQDLNQQLYAIGMKKSAEALLQKINAALTELQNDGTLQNLTVEYLGVDPADVVVPPTLTPTAVQPTQKPSGCLDDAKWVKDLSYDDKKMTDPPELKPGEAFTKGWRMKNVGSCTWTNGKYRLVFSYGDPAAAQMGGQPIPVTRDVKPGETYDFYVNLIAPIRPGEYVSYWNMQNAANTRFGQKVWVDIIVVGAATPTPPPTQTPAPNISFSARPTTITAGESVLFQWSTDNVKAVYFYHDGQNWWEHQAPEDGQATEYPSYTINYHLHVVQRDGKEVDRVTLITVNAPPDAAPVIEYLTSTPPQITLGESVGIDWKINGPVHQAQLYVDDVAVLDPAPVQGHYEDIPQTTGTHVYKLMATGPGGQDTDQVRVNVLAQPTEEPVVPTPTPEPTVEPVPQPPEIWGFEPSPTTIEAGQSVMISWTTGGGTTYIELLRNDELIWMDTQLNNSVPDTPPAEAGATIRYVLVAYNNAGQTESREAIVRVADAPPENLLANSSWQLRSMQGAGDIPAEVYITAFFSADGSLSGSAGCNPYTAPYSSNGEEIIIHTPSGGGSSCGEPYDSLEQAYLGLLPGTANFSLQGNRLVLFNNSGQEILSFIRAG